MRRALHLAAAAAIGISAATAPQLAQAQPARAAQLAGAHQPHPAHRAHRAHLAGPAGIVAAAGDLVNASTGRRLWARGLDGIRPIASLTKVMAAIVVIRAGHLGRKIKVTEAAVAYAKPYSATTAGLHAGDVLTTWQLLEGLLLPSGADAAYLLAQSYGPGWPAFVVKMNALARELGLTQTHFANFDGLPWPTEYSTYSSPRDLITMARYAMRLRAFREIVRQRHHWIAATRQHHHYYWVNTDLLLDTYRGAIGIKTGFTLGAGYCLLFEARRAGRALLGVVLDSTATDPAMRFTAASRLLNWGFSVTRRRAADAG